MDCYAANLVAHLYRTTASHWKLVCYSSRGQTGGLYSCKNFTYVCQLCLPFLSHPKLIHLVMSLVTRSLYSCKEGSCTCKPQPQTASTLDCAGKLSREATNKNNHQESKVQLLKPTLQLIATLPPSYFVHWLISFQCFLRNIPNPQILLTTPCPTSQLCSAGHKLPSPSGRSQIPSDWLIRDPLNNDLWNNPHIIG